MEFFEQSEHLTADEYNEYPKKRIAKANKMEDKKLEAIANSIMTWSVSEAVPSKDIDVVLQVDESDDYTEYLGPHENQYCDYQGHVAPDHVRCRLFTAANGGENEGKDSEMPPNPLRPVSKKVCRPQKEAIVRTCGKTAYINASWLNTCTRMEKSFVAT